MNTTLITAGIACIVGAIVGGGLKAFAIEIPALHSGTRQIALGGFGVILLAASLPLNGWLPGAAQGPAAAGPEASPTPAGAGCSPTWFGGAPPARVAVIEAGATDVEVQATSTESDGRRVVVIADDGRPVGAVTFALRSHEMFVVSGVVNAACERIESFHNETRGGDPSVLQNWDILDVTFGTVTFALRLGYSSGTVTANLIRFRGSDPTSSRTVPGPGPTGVCSAGWFGNAPSAPVTIIETGGDAEIRSADGGLDGPLIVVITDNGRAVGAISLRFYGGNTLFKIGEVVDSTCRSVDSFRNESRGGDRHVLQNFDTVALTFGTLTYTLRLGYSAGSISGQVSRV